MAVLSVIFLKLYTTGCRQKLGKNYNLLYMITFIRMVYCIKYSIQYIHIKSQFSQLLSFLFLLHRHTFHHVFGLNKQTYKHQTRQIQTASKGTVHKRFITSQQISLCQPILNLCFTNTTLKLSNPGALLVNIL